MPRDAAASIIIFDVNETLLDITTLEPVFYRVYGDRSVLREWFAQLILYSQAVTLSGLYTPFGELAVGVLRMAASIRGVAVADSDIDELKERLDTMPAHPDAVPAARCGFPACDNYSSTRKSLIASHFPNTN